MLNIFNREIVYKKNILTLKECKDISNYIIKNEERIKSMGEDIFDKTPDNSLTGRFWCFNYLNVGEVGEILVPKLRKVFLDLTLKNPIYVQCWANTYRKGDYIEPHIHEDSTYKDSFLSANIFLEGDTFPGTTYYFNKGKNKKDIKNSVGEMLIFKSNLYHEVKPYTKNDIRVTMAFDIHYCPQRYSKDYYREMDFDNNLRFYKIT